MAEKRIDLAYDLVGQLDWIKRYASIATTNEPVAVSDFTFDRAGRLESIDHAQGDEPSLNTRLAGYNLTWNQRNELEGLDFAPDNSSVDLFDYTSEDVTYAYDARGQLVGADYTGLSDESYDYDENGNRELVTNVAGTGQVYDTSGDNRLDNNGTYTYEYDNEGNRTRRTDAATGDYTIYTWDHRNRLVQVTDYDSQGTPSETDDIATLYVWNHYDAENEWIRRQVYDVAGGGLFRQTVFVYEEAQIVLQFDVVGFDDAVASDLSHRYLWGPIADELLADEVVASLSDAGQNEVLWPLADHLGTIRDVVDSAGTLRKHTSFDSYGRITDEQFFDNSGNSISASHSEAIEQLFGYTGRPLDRETELQNNLHRWYDANTGRWLSEDWIDDDVANLYRYVGNIPTMYVDPVGLAVRPPKGLRYFSISRWEWVELDDISEYSDDERREIVDELNSHMIGLVMPLSVGKAACEQGAGFVHHIATNKNFISKLRGGPWSQRFERLFRRAGMTLEDAANKVRLPVHHGPHPEAYHREVYDRLTRATRELRGKTAIGNALNEELGKLGNECKTAGSKLNSLLNQ